MINIINPIDLFDIKKPITDVMVPGIVPNKYFVSSYGNIFSINKDTNKFELMGYNKNSPYAKVTLRMTDGSRKTIYVYKLIAMAFYPIDGMQSMNANFIDGNRLNLKASNLEWVTRDKQLAYARSKRDIEHSVTNTDFTVDTIHTICKLIQAGISNTNILKSIGMEATPTNLKKIQRIAKGDTWKHISKDYNFPNR